MPLDLKHHDNISRNFTYWTRPRRVNSLSANLQQAAANDYTAASSNIAATTHDFHYFKISACVRRSRKTSCCAMSLLAISFKWRWHKVRACSSPNGQFSFFCAFPGPLTAGHKRQKESRYCVVFDHHHHLHHHHFFFALVIENAVAITWDALSRFLFWRLLVAWTTATLLYDPKRDAHSFFQFNWFNSVVSKSGARQL